VIDDLFDSDFGIATLMKQLGSDLQNAFFGVWFPHRGDKV
jgi:hypothetical protein